MAHAARCPVVERVGRIAALHPDRTAVVGTAEVLDYRELWLRVDAWWERCATLGLAPGTLVAVLCGDGTGLPSAFLGARAAGLVPLLIDEGLPQSGVDAVWEAARPAAVLRADKDELEPTGEPNPRTLPTEAGYVVFSSGTQDTPKGIVGQAAGLLAFLDWEIAELDVRPGTRVAMLTSPSFDVVYRDLLLPLCSGGELHIANQAVRFTPPAVLPWLAEHGIEVLHAVPSLSARWLVADGPTVDSLRYTLFAGEPLYGRHVQRWRAAAPRTRVVNLYGPSETTLARFHHEIPADCGPGLQPVGRPLPNARVDLVPAEPTSEHGDALRVLITTPHGSLGYLPGTCSPDDLSRLRREHGITRFQTQDRGLLDPEGNLVIVGRLDSLVKRRGTFVDIMRIEAAAAELAEVRAACCVQLTSNSEIVLAVEGPDPAAAAGLHRRLRAPLGRDIPDRVVVLPTLPLLPGGKADRRRVRELLNLEETARGLQGG
ncbi:AMP-binding protein [Actinospica durhamensis]|uniref:AMP-binding protein n=1 Tax=Actinospica durhamensis TaxID=1508375 RepID=A0A941EPQ1_9ACTN|nr:AMP-binding protein [Actinospica durhamensis]MBR7834258.1 AMP-binding protein [Actinospica durhamensis]